jgi:hypothetical protein
MTIADVRLFTEATRTFAVPADLRDLAGPSTGSLTLPDTVYWGPESVVDLAHWDDLAKAYEATLREGDLAEVCGIVNADLLRRFWNQLVFPSRIRAAWEERFSSLAA